MGDVEDRAEQPYAASSAGLVSDSVQVEPCVGVEGSGLPTTTETTPQTPIPSVRTRSSSSRAQIGFPPIRLDINAPVGSYLNPHTSSTEGGRSYISRSGYAQLARSSAFVTGLSDDIDVLLDTWSKEWLSLTAQPATDASHKEPIGDGEAHSNGLGSAHIQAKHAGPSPFQLFVEVYQRLGWHNAQMTWSEHEPTRAAMYETCIRSFTDRLQPLAKCMMNDANDGLDELDEDGIGAMEILQMCGVLFALNVLQATSILGSNDRWTPRCSGRVPIEADIYRGLLKLPKLARCGLQSKDRSQDGLLPEDDVVFVLRSMLGEKAGDNPSGNTPRSDGVFDIMSPTLFSARSPIVTNSFTTRAEKDRSERLYGKLREDQSQARSQNGLGEAREFSLTRAELVHSLLRERLDLPQHAPCGSTSSSGGAEYVGVARRRQSQEPPLSLIGVETVTRRTGVSRIGQGLPPSRAAETEMERTLNSAGAAYARYESLAHNLFGSTGVAGSGDLAQQVHEREQAAAAQGERVPANLLRSSTRRSTRTQSENNGAPSSSEDTSSTAASRDASTPYRGPLWRSQQPVTAGDIIREARLRTQLTMQRTLHQHPEPPPPPPPH